MQDFDNAKGRASKSPRMSDYADMATWPEGEYGNYRMIGPLYCVLSYWFTIRTPRKPEGVSIPKMCLDHDGATDEYVSESCPFRASGLGRESREYFINVIDRAEQEGRQYPPLRGMRIEEHLGYKAYWMRAGDSRKTPVRLLAIPDSQIDKLKGMKKLNRFRGRDGEVAYAGMMDPNYGCDLGLLYDPNKQGPAKYDIQKLDRAPISREERAYGMYRPDLLKPMRIEEAKREMEDLAGKIVEKDARGKGKGGARGGARPEAADDPLMEDSSVRMSERDLEEPRGRGRARDPYGEREERGARGGRDAYADEPADDYDEPRGRGGRGRRDDPVDDDLGALDDDFGGGGRAQRGVRRDDDYGEREEPRGRGRARDLDYDEPRRERAPSRARGDRDSRGGRQEPRDARGRGPRERDFDDLPF